MRSTLFFSRAIMGFHDLTDHLHGNMALWIESDSRRKLGLAPRAHCKSSLWTVADLLRRATADPNIRILIINETQENASNFLSLMKNVVLNSRIYRLLFPELIPEPDKVRWNSTMMELVRDRQFPEPTITAIGVGGASTSRHYDIVHEDDLVGKEAAESDLVMKKAIRQHQLAESLLIHPGCEIRTVGTRWKPYDLAEWMLKNEPALDFLKLSIWQEQDVPWWPERFPPDVIRRLRRKYGAAFFALQYENVALAEGVTEFKAEWLRHYKMGKTRDGKETIILERPDTEGGPITHLLEDCDVVTTLDPGISPDSKDARTAIVTIATTPDNPFNIVILEAKALRNTPEKTIRDAWETYQRFKPHTIGIEVVVSQMTYMYWIPQVYPTLPIRRLKTDTHKKKESRIREFAPYAEQGRLYYDPNMVDFLEEFETFPNGRTVDLIDALAYTPQVWCPPTPLDSAQNWMEDWQMAERHPEWAERTRNKTTGYAWLLPLLTLVGIS